MDLGRVFESRVVVLLLIGVAALIVSRVLKRGRLEGEHPSGLENLLWFGGMVLTLATIIFALSQGFDVDVPQAGDGGKQLERFEREPSGCGRSTHKHLKKFGK